MVKQTFFSETHVVINGFFRKLACSWGKLKVRGYQRYIKIYAVSKEILMNENWC